MVKACITCKEEYYGNSWGVTFSSPMKGDPDWDEFTNELVVCYYCYYGVKELEYQPKWESKEKGL
jgi:hypothetical protein